MMKITIGNIQRKWLQKGAVMLFAYSDERGFLTESEHSLLGNTTVKKSKEFLTHCGYKGNVKEISYFPEQRTLYLFVGLGKKKELTPEILRRATNEGRSILRKMNVPEAVVLVPGKDANNLTMEEKFQSLCESLWLGDYEFDKYKADRSRKKLREVTLLVPEITSEFKKILKRTKVICEAVNMARNLENDNSDHVTPESFAQEAQEIARNHQLRFKVLDERTLQQKGFGLLYNVGRASANPPRLVVLEYRGNPTQEKVTAIVGKGITFDTGGVNLKLAGSMIEEMHMDMSGAAVALATINAAAELQMPVNLVAAIPLAENAIGGNAYKPGCVLKAYDGTTVEVGNTDAEGRLILGDAVAYVVDQYHPSEMIDLATLTGAVLVALGHRIAGLISNNDGLANALQAAGEKTAERVWRLPSDADYQVDIKSEKAEIKNVGEGRTSGVITGAMFIEHFVKKIPWAHIDIAGTSMIPKRLDYLPKGGTGFGIRLLLEYFMQQAANVRKK